MILTRLSSRARLGILAAHIVLLLCGVAFVWAELADVASQNAQVEQTRQSVADLKSRTPALGKLAAAVPPVPPIDPFLPGSSLTVAGANLQERVVSGIRKAGGTVASSQVDLSEAAGTPSRVILAVNCEIDATALQQLLYEFESGTPYLLFDQFTIDAEPHEGGEEPASTAGAAARLKIAFSVSAYWGGPGLERAK